MKDLHNNIKVEIALNTISISSNTITNGNIIDMQSFGSVEFVIQSGNLTDGSYTPIIHEGDTANLSDATAVADANLLGTEAAASFSSSNDNQVNKIGYIGNKRYVRLSIVSISTSSGGTLSAIAIKANPANLPVG